jgi:hypothetical protein
MDTKHEQLSSGAEKEVMQVPEVEYQRREGIALHHILEKISTEGDDRYTEVIESYQSISADFDAESLGWISLIYDNPEITDQIISDIQKHKGAESVTVAQIKYYLNTLGKLEELLTETGEYADYLGDPDLDPENRTELEGKLAKTVDFFQPQVGTTSASRVVVIPTSRELIGESGWGYATGDTAYVISPIDKTDNQTHEFLHAVVNPIVEKMDISGDEERQVVELASSRLVEDEGYGEHAQSLLGETLIRVYCRRILGEVDGYFSLGEFQEVVDRLSDERFAEISTDEKMKKRMQGLDVATLDDFKAKAREYYDLYEKNDLAQKIIILYKEYQTSGTEESTVNFEDYFLANWHKIID